MKICWENPDLVEMGLTFWALCVKTQVCLHCWQRRKIDKKRIFSSWKVLGCYSSHGRVSRTKISYLNNSTVENMLLHSVVAFSLCILLTRGWTVKIELTFAFPWQQWLLKHATVLCYMHIAYLVTVYHEDFFCMKNKLWHCMPFPYSHLHISF
jgi:hypothetical protein